MSKISYEEILAIQRKINIVDIIKDYIPLTQRGRNYFGICPFHDDHNPSMSVSNEKQMYKCFVCGAAGNVFNFVMDYEKVNYYTAVKIVGDKLGLNIDIGNIKEEKRKVNPLYNIYELSTKYYQNNLNTPSGKIARKYLSDRKIDDEVINFFKIGLSPVDNSLCKLLKSKKIENEQIIKSGIGYQNDNKVFDIYKNRIMFPLWDLNGNVVGYSGRIYDDSDESKYINTMETEIFKKGNLLYNYHNAKISSRKEKKIIVVEGFMDVIRLHTIGITNVVATMGTAITKYQADLIRKLAYNIILMFDGDSAGDKATKNAIEELKDYDVNIKIVRLEDNLDPDEYILKNGKDKMVYHINHPLTLFKYKSDYLKKDFDFNDPQDVSKYINLIKNDLQKIDDDIVRNIEIKNVSKQVGVDEELIKSKLDIKKNNVKIITSKKEVKINKYKKASNFILFQMINNSEFIDYYYNNLSFLPGEIDRALGTEIILFYKKFKSFNLNDFIVYLKDKKDLINRIIEISDLNYNKNIKLEELDSYFDSIREYINKKEIEKLTEELKNTSNEVLKKEIASKIVAIRIKEKK